MCCTWRILCFTSLYKFEFLNDKNVKAPNLIVFNQLKKKKKFGHRVIYLHHIRLSYIQRCYKCLLQLLSIQQLSLLLLKSCWQIAEPETPFLYIMVELELQVSLNLWERERNRTAKLTMRSRQAWYRNILSISTQWT